MAKFLAVAGRVTLFGCLVAMLFFGLDARAAKYNPAVRQSFFEELHASLPTAQPAPVKVDGDVTEVTWQGLAWEVENVSNSHVPLVIELYSSDVSQCNVFGLPQGYTECVVQLPQFPPAAAKFRGKVRFVRFDVSQHPSLLTTPDIRVLPTHMFIHNYFDTSHYTAFRIWGYLDANELVDAVRDNIFLSP